MDVYAGFGMQALPLSREESVRDLDAEKIRLRKVAVSFEAIFIRQLLKTMRSTVPGGTMFGSGAAGEMYADIAEAAVADAMAKEERFGIADVLYRRLLKSARPGISDTNSVSVKNIPQDQDRK